MSNYMTTNLMAHKNEQGSLKLNQEEIDNYKLISLMNINARSLNKIIANE